MIININLTQNLAKFKLQMIPILSTSLHKLILGYWKEGLDKLSNLSNKYQKPSIQGSGV
jgi:hypothetical protein